MKILYVTTVALTMSFFPEHIKMLQNQGYTVELAANQTKPLSSKVAALNCPFHQIDFSRSPLSKDNLTAYRQLKKLLDEGNYDIVHTHTPNASAMVRLAARKLRKKGLKVFYTAHGFHFYKGAPVKNWLLYYPVEWLCAHWTDTLITINHEDCVLAQKHMHAQKVEYIPGVGLDLNRFQNVSVDRALKRRELGVPEDATLLLSVGELNSNKNHQVIIRALSQLQNDQIHYAIAGTGDQHDELLKLADEMNVSRQVHLLGYRSDVATLYSAADICCFPSIREGLGMAALEAMACGLPLIAADNRGTRDYCQNGENAILCSAEDIFAFKNAISLLVSHPELRKKMGEKGISIVSIFSSESALDALQRVYKPYLL